MSHSLKAQRVRFSNSGGVDNMGPLKMSVVFPLLIHQANTFLKALFCLIDKLMRNLFLIAYLLRAN